MQKLLKTLLLSIVMLCVGVQAQALNKDVQIDIITNKINILLKSGKAMEALPYFAELEGLQATLPESFDFFYIDTLDKAGQGDMALVRSGGYLMKYEKKGKYYGEVIEVFARRSMEAEAKEWVLTGEFVAVPGGCFKANGKQTCVDAFRIGKFEVTQGQYEGVMGRIPSKFNECGPDCPVVNVSWDDAQAFISRLNNLTGKRYRLPTEAEWEYACRGGGRNQEYCGGDDIDTVAWYDGNSRSTAHPVGQKQPNSLGIYDMSGNVWEWVQDWYDSDYPSSGNNPQGVTSGSHRVRRGGSWYFTAERARAADRSGASPSVRDSLLGFRLVDSVQ